jgi:3-isopropylmalate/(R)-2-methylmalate dehydratase small subunit
MVLYGTTYVVGDTIGTNAILAPDHHTDDPADLAAQCLTSVDPHIAELVRPSDMLLAGQDFGHGPHPEPAILALQAVGFSIVICASAAPTFVELAAIYGLPVLICPAAIPAIAPGSIVRVDLATGQITDRTTGALFTTTPCSSALLAAVRQTQLLNRMRQVVADEGFDG